VLRISSQSLTLSLENFITTESCKFIPRCLLNFIVWLVNDSCFYQENNYEGISNDILRKCISIAECEIFLAGYFQNQEAVKFSKDNVSDCEEILSTQEKYSPFQLQESYIGHALV
jgi:hypothetical protein